MRRSPQRRKPKKPGFKPICLNAATRRQLIACGKIWCTTREVAAQLDIDETTLMDWFNRQPAARALFERSKEQGKISLRRAQLQAAIDDKNITAMIWCGKQLLGQTDKAQVRHTIEFDLSKLSTAELQTFLPLLEKVTPDDERHPQLQ